MTINLFGRGAIFDVGDEEIDQDADQLDIPIHAFDLVIADECHRGYTSSEVAVWRKTLDHFDAVKVGLTATPAAHTTSYFKDIVYRYEYERAVREGFLVDYDVVSVKSARPDARHLPQGGRGGRRRRPRDGGPPDGPFGGRAPIRHERGGRKSHFTRLESEDPRGGEKVCSGTASQMPRQDD